MKKAILLFSVIGIVTLASSCKKDYVCQCEANANGITAESTVNINDTKKNAEEQCESAKASLETQVGSGTASCSLN